MDALTQEEAFVAVLTLSAFADGTMGAEEDEELADVLARARPLASLDEAGRHAAIVKADKIARGEGDASLLARAAASLRADLRPTAFCLGADIVLADGEIAAEERAFLDRLRTSLAVDPALAERIVEVVLIRNRA